MFCTLTLRCGRFFMISSVYTPAMPDNVAMITASRMPITGADSTCPVQHPHSLPSAQLAKLIERCSDGGEDQGADEALWGSRESFSSVLEAVSRVSGSPFSSPPACWCWCCVDAVQVSVFVLMPLGGDVFAGEVWLCRRLELTGGGLRTCSDWEVVCAMVQPSASSVSADHCTGVRCFLRNTRYRIPVVMMLRFLRIW